MVIFIPGNTPSSKNSKRWTGKTLISNPQTLKYKKHNAWFFLQNKAKFLYGAKLVQPPFHIGFHFVRDSKRKFDFINALQIVQDMMVEHNLIEDDNMDLLIPYPLILNNNYYTVDPKYPGVYIKLLEPHRLDLQLNSLLAVNLAQQAYQ